MSRHRLTRETSGIRGSELLGATREALIAAHSAHGLSALFFLCGKLGTGTKRKKEIKERKAGELSSDASGRFTVGTSGSAYGVPFYSANNIFYDGAFFVSTSSVLDLAGLSQCTYSCNQTYSAVSDPNDFLRRNEYRELSNYI